MLNMFCFWHCFLSFVLFPDFNCLWIILFWRSILFHVLRYFHFCWSIGMRFWSDFYCNLFLDMFCFWHCFSLFVLCRYLVDYFIVNICFVFDITFFHLFSFQFQLFVNYSFLKKYLVSDCEIFSFLLKYWY